MAADLHILSPSTLTCDGVPHTDCALVYLPSDYLLPQLLFTGNVAAPMKINKTDRPALARLGDTSS